MFSDPKLEEELKLLGEKLKEMNQPLGGGYKNAAEVPGIKDSKYDKLSPQEKALVNRQVDRTVERMRRENDKLGLHAQLKNEKSIFTPKEIVFDRINNFREDLANPKTIQNLKTMEENLLRDQQRQRER